MSTILPEGGMIPSERALRTSTQALGSGLKSGLEGMIVREAMKPPVKKETTEGQVPSSPHEEMFRQQQKMLAARSFVSPEQQAVLDAFDPFRRLESEEKYRAVEKGRIEEFRKPFISEVKSSFPDLKLSDETISQIFDSKMMKNLVGKNANTAEMINELRSPRARTLINFYGNLDQFINEAQLELFKNKDFLTQQLDRLTTDAKNLFSDDPAQLENIYRQLQNVSKLKGQAGVAKKLFSSDKPVSEAPDKLTDVAVLDWLVKNKEALNPMTAKALLLEKFAKGLFQRRSARKSVEIQKLLQNFYPEGPEMRLAEGITYQGFFPPEEGLKGFLEEMKGLSEEGLKGLKGLSEEGIKGFFKEKPGKRGKRL